jgi:hypothetical protein
MSSTAAAASVLLEFTLSGCGPAAPAVAHEWVDRRAAADYPGVWLLFGEQVREGISQEGYVTVSETFYEFHPEAAVNRFFLRQRGSAELKPIADPHRETSA